MTEIFVNAIPIFDEGSVHKKIVSRVRNGDKVVLGGRLLTDDERDQLVRSYQAGCDSTDATFRLRGLVYEQDLFPHQDLTTEMQKELRIKALSLCEQNPPRQKID